MQVARSCYCQWSWWTAGTCRSHKGDGVVAYAGSPTDTEAVWLGFRVSEKKVLVVA